MNALCAVSATSPLSQGNGYVRALPVDGVEANGSNLDENFAFFQDCRHEVVGNKSIGLLGSVDQKGSLTVQNGRRLEGFLFLLDYNRWVVELHVSIGGGGVHSLGGGGRRGGHGCNRLFGSGGKFGSKYAWAMRLSTIAMKYNKKKKEGYIQRKGMRRVDVKELEKFYRTVRQINGREKRGKKKKKEPLFKAWKIRSIQKFH